MQGSPLKRLTRANADHRGGVSENKAQGRGASVGGGRVWIWLEEKENCVLR